MVQLPDRLQFEPPILDRFAPNLLEKDRLAERTNCEWDDD